MSLKQITTGQDSFLDIVANLVGILIILVVVVGAQASASWVKTKPKTDLIEKIDSLETQVSRSADVVRKLQIDNEQLEKQILKENRLAANLTDQRHEMLVQMEIIKREMLKQQEEIAKQQSIQQASFVEDVRKQNQFEEEKRILERELEAISREANAVTASTPKKETIEHFPNPIAKTVFSEEVHFRLSRGRLAYVPMDELITRMKSEWKVKAEKLKRANRTIETVGPVGNFRLQYELASGTGQQNTRVGAIEKRMVRFQQFEILPRPGVFGETIEEALSTDSHFKRILSRNEAGRTTVSIWVYPDSFEDHNRVKGWLHENGFQMASWPLEFGRKIAGGPNGLKTSAQ